MTTKRTYTKLTSEAYEALAKLPKDSQPKTWALEDVRFVRQSGNRMLEFVFPTELGPSAPLKLLLPVAMIDELKAAKAKDLETVRLSPAGDSIIADGIDVLISVEGLFKDISKKAPAVRRLMSLIFAARGGESTSPRKHASSIENGKKGGRPKRLATEHALAQL